MSSLAIKRAAPANPVIAAVTTAQVFALASNSAAACTIGAPGHLAIEGKKFMVRAEGNLQTVGAYTALPTLLAKLATPASPLVPGNWTIIGAGTARAVGTAWSPWWIEAELQFDSISGIMHGIFSAETNNLYDARAAISNTITGINGTNTTLASGNTAVPTEPALVFAVALTFNTGGLNIGNLYNFELGF
jgi:hypothetical protein